MEEARQHTALTWETIPIGALYIGGLLAVLLGIIAQFTIGGRSLQLGLLVFVWSNVLLSIWSIVRPATFPRKQSRASVKVLVLLGWVVFGVLLGMPFLNYSL